MDLRSIVMGVGFAIMWSSAFTSARIIVEAAPPLSALALRFLISGGLGVGLALILGQSWRLTAAQWRACIILGICQNALYLGLNFVAMQTIEASLAVIIASMMPLLVALASWLFLSQKLTKLTVAGLLAGFAGVALVMGTRFSGGVDPYGLTLCIIGAVALTVATLSVRGATSGGNFLMVVGLQMLIGGAVLAVVATFTETLVIDWSWKLGAAFAWTTLIPGLAATLVWFKLVQRINATRAATFHFLNPFLGVAIAAIVLGEQLHPTDLIGVAIIMGGILAVQLSRRPAKDKPTPVSS
ncbi:DMT family transporter [Roseovarius nanhaiticus]|uniref:Threonine/homoserine efflux transporter RhtA n=1 Tax=Roseovarius nanhaiticus TaxID=573024 RepID=A0A1N7EGC8_9RHOB|nr:DMT family transporter [Roseovarius nanhaiticus]SEK75031.1 Threonine/homoserine efflux transporter RhtA [Roseovarius nanhaiticus]SIR87213.1 Threonine/homoserine efflux transporter RhtA [Roseovarius nanhaiticus]